MTEAQATYLTTLCNQILAVEITRQCKITRMSNPPQVLAGLHTQARERLAGIASGEYLVRGASNAIETSKSDLARARRLAA
jgi:hypothetical protein